MCAEMHNDKHTVKMILEYAQLLSTAHRFLDGAQTVGKSSTGRKKTTYVLPDERDMIMYSATHINHPSAVWARKCSENYSWLHDMLTALCKEYTYRYGKVHKVEREGLLESLRDLPHSINIDLHFTEPTTAMPDEYKVPGDAVTSYRKYYVGDKQRMAKWKNRYKPCLLYTSPSPRDS